MELTGWKPVYEKLDVRTVREGVEGLKEEGNWPVVTGGKEQK